MNSLIKNLLPHFFVLFISSNSIANEGMWLPFLLEQQVITNMQTSGCKLTAEQIYSINEASLKDAIIKIGAGCSGGILSKEGLILTNHHCVEYFIQQSSTLESNYLKQGFWAQSKQEEIITKGLKVSILQYMTDVTGIILKNIPNNMSYTSIKNIVEFRKDSISQALNKTDENLSISIESLYGGNQYILVAYYEYADVRLVGFPPSDLASFGPSIDNWSWPRHSADFALLRIYVDANNKPAKFSETNIPFVPKKSLQINTSGVKENDYTMVLGYPYETKNYSTSHEVSLIYNNLNPIQIGIRELRIAPIKNYIEKGEEEYLAYYPQYFELMNYYTKWIGEQKAIERSQVISIKKQEEDSINKWIKADSERTAQYGNTIELYNKAQDEYYKNFVPLTAYFEGFWRTDFFKLLDKYVALKKGLKTDNYISKLDKLQEDVTAFFNTYCIDIEKESIPLIFNFFEENITAEFIPEFYRNLTQEEKEIVIKNLVTNSFLFNKESATLFFEQARKEPYLSDPKQITTLLEADKGYLFASQIKIFISQSLYPDYIKSISNLDSINLVYNKLKLDYYTTKKMYPDANGTLRLSYGKVAGYTPINGVYFTPLSTHTGIVEKWALQNKEYAYNKKLDSLIQNKQFGSYFNDTLYVNFLATNQTTGGSSGSPVLDKNGNIIGVNFDRTQLGIISDYMYDPNICRNISVDIRYILFYIEVYGKAPNLISELEILK